MYSIVRALLLVLILVVVGVFLMQYVSIRTPQTSPTSSVGTSGTIDRARETGAEIGEKAGAATAKVQETLSEAALTTKIKAKMALDDSVKARAIDVTTRGTTVTLTGTVRSAAERERAVALARETVGVTQVVDNLQMQKP